MLNTNGEPVSNRILRRMTDALAHRGPDDHGYWTNRICGLGHRRLSIVDLTAAAHQPMQNQDGTLFLVYNGEVYNYQNLRAELQALGHRFTSTGDTEVVLRAFMEWGPACVERFNGMFALAVWDKRSETLFLARDRYGMKPLYYWHRNGAFLFASEIKSLLEHPDVQVRVCVPALNEYFSFQNIFSDLTLFEHVRLLPPGCTLTVTAAGDVTMRRYWDYAFRDELTHITEDEALEELSHLFHQAVQRQLMGDVPIGSYLSGGMDSGAITAVAAQSLDDMTTFTCGFDLSAASGRELSFDERAKAEFLSSLVHSLHYEVVLKAGDMERVLRKMVWHLEDLRVGQSYPNYYVSGLASRFVKVILSGAGGDELFAGYPWRYHRTTDSVDFAEYAETYYRYWQRLIPDRFKPEFYQPSIYPEIWTYQTKDVFRDTLGTLPCKQCTPEDYVNHSLYFECKTFLHGLLVVDDRLSMAHALEQRLPFLDNDLVDFAMRLPVRLKLRNLTERVRMDENEPGPKNLRYFKQTADGKLILRRMVERFVPESYANGIKQGFSAPDATWFKGQSAQYIREMILTPRARIYEYLQPGKVEELVNEHFNGAQNRRLLIWSLLNFEIWLHTFAV
jgi:asparagine synthase (glutamine-hydrolysing)